MICIALAVVSLASMILIFLELFRCRSREDTGSIGGSACCFEHAADAAACRPGCSARGPECGRQRPRRTPPTVDGGCLEAL